MIGRLTGARLLRVEFVLLGPCEGFGVLLSDCLFDQIGPQPDGSADSQNRNTLSGAHPESGLHNFRSLG